MASNIVAASTPEELAKQFPDTNRPFAVWYNHDPDINRPKWAVNGDDGDVLECFKDLAVALKTAAKLSAEIGWDEEARKQALILAEIEAAMSEDEKATLAAKVEKLLEEKSRDALAVAEYHEARPLRQYEKALQAATDEARELLAECADTSEYFRKERARQVGAIVPIIVEKTGGWSFTNGAMEKISRALDALRETILEGDVEFSPSIFEQGRIMNIAGRFERHLTGLCDKAEIDAHVQRFLAETRGQASQADAPTESEAVHA